MKLNYIEIPKSLGGTAVSECGTIHKSEIKATLAQLSIELNLPFDLNDYTLGSTGKREYSGDIDLVIDNKWWTEGPGAFREKLEKKYGKSALARNGDMVHLKYPIIGYNISLNEAHPRTGFVQIDFNFGDVEWEKFYHYSPGEESAYKGAHRNLAISAICAVTGVIASNDVDGYDRPVMIIRNKFGPKGLFKIVRVSSKDLRSGVWKKKQEDIILDGPYFNPEDIAHLVFMSEEAKSEDLNSLETIMCFVKKHAGLVEREKIWKRMASNFSDWNIGKLFSYPEEISQYFHVDDK